MLEDSEPLGYCLIVLLAPASRVPGEPFALPATLGVDQPPVIDLLNLVTGLLGCLGQTLRGLVDLPRLRHCLAPFVLLSADKKNVTRIEHGAQEVSQKEFQEGGSNGFPARAASQWSGVRASSPYFSVKARMRPSGESGGGGPSLITPPSSMAPNAAPTACGSFMSTTGVLLSVAARSAALSGSACSTRLAVGVKAVSLATVRSEALLRLVLLARGTQLLSRGGVLPTGAHAVFVGLGHGPGAQLAVRALAVRLLSILAEGIHRLVLATLQARLVHCLAFPLFTR